MLGPEYASPEMKELKKMRDEQFEKALVTHHTRSTEQGLYVCVCGYVCMYVYACMSVSVSLCVCLAFKNNEG